MKIVKKDHGKIMVRRGGDEKNKPLVVGVVGVCNQNK